MGNNNKHLADDLNPQFLFSTIHSDLLTQAVNNKIDLLQLAKKELANRGLDSRGLWVGFQKAKEIHGVK